ncbi:MAG: hypothetical protein JO001_22355 [Alphaproteobacteria bacterium]|nr:hypothetical protein [Alphaproteobacteria bacterium]
MVKGILIGRQRLWPIRFWLARLAILGVVPVWIISGLILYDANRQARAELESDTVQLAHALVLAVDAELTAAQATLEALAISHNLGHGEIDVFQAKAKQILTNTGGDQIVLFDADGKELIDESKELVDELPSVGMAEVVRKVISSGKPVISDYHMAPPPLLGQIAVAVPIVHNNQVSYVLSMAFSSVYLSEVLRQQRLRPGWIAAIIDNSGTILARTQDPELWVGHSATSQLLERASALTEGTLNDRTREGIPVVAAFSQSARSHWRMVIGIPSSGLTTKLRHWIWLSIAELSIALSIALLLSWRAGIRIANSIQALKRSAFALASDEPISIPPPEISEIAAVGEALKAAEQLLTDRTRARDLAVRAAQVHQAELAHAARVSVAGEMAAAMAHELAQPLSTISAYAHASLQLMGRAQPNTELVREGIGEIVDAADRGGKILSRLRDFMQRNPPRQGPVDVGAIIEVAASLARGEAIKAAVAISIVVAPGLPRVVVDDIQIEQVILNLIRNAIDALKGVTPSSRLIIIEAKQVISRIEVSVSDNGPGVSEEILETLFHPFATTKAHGMGMGLSISRTIIEAHGGTLHLAKSPRSGATFVFDLPIEPLDTRSKTPEEHSLA